MKKERRNMEEIDRFIGKTFGMSQAENSSEQSVSEFREKGMKTIQEQKQQETGHAIEHALSLIHISHSYPCQKCVDLLLSVHE